MPCLACGLPSTSEQIARVAKLNERYVREWLGAMVTVGMVEYDPATRKYHLTQEHAVCLTHAHGRNRQPRYVDPVYIGNVEGKARWWNAPAKPEASRIRNTLSSSNCKQKKQRESLMQGLLTR
jgi:hypothetical protein